MTSADKGWEAIKAAGAKALPQGKRAQAEAMIRWQRGEGVAFWEMCETAERGGPAELRRVIRQYVECFGQEGARADLAWAMAYGGGGLLPDRGAVDPPHRDKTAKDPRVLGMREVNRMICQAEVERWLREPEFGERYYGVVVWSGVLFSYPDADATDFQVLLRDVAEHFPQAGDADYWFYARAFLVLAHSVGRDDLYRGKDAQDLRAGATTLAAWVTGDDVENHLRPDDRRHVWVYDATWVNSVEDGRMGFALPEKPFENDGGGKLWQPVPEVWEVYDDPGEEPGATMWRVCGEIGKQLGA